jgi:hypothetical protein
MLPPAMQSTRISNIATSCDSDWRVTGYSMTTFPG